MNFLRTYEDKEIDLVVRRPGKPLLLLEINSSERVTIDHVKTLVDLTEIIDAPSEMALFSCDPVSQIIDVVRCVHWQQGLRDYFTGPDLTEF